MLLPSSLPAQAPSAIGSSRIAARFADIRNCNSFLIVCPSALLIALERILDRPPAKWNWYLAHRASVRISEKQRRPATIGEAMARAGPDIHGRGGGAMWSKPRPRISVSRAW